MVAKLIERGAADLDGLAATLRGTDLEDLGGKLRGLAKSRPGLIIGVAALAAIVLPGNAEGGDCLPGPTTIGELRYASFKGLVH